MIKFTKNDLSSEINEDFNGIVYATCDDKSVVLKGIGTLPEEEF